MFIISEKLMSTKDTQPDVIFIGPLAADVAAYLVLSTFLDTEKSNFALGNRIVKLVPISGSGNWRCKTSGSGTVVLENSGGGDIRRFLQGDVGLPTGPVVPKQQPEDHAITDEPKSMVGRMWVRFKNTWL